MSKRRSPIDYLNDILDAAAHAEHFISGTDFESFQRNAEKVFAVTRALEIIGEAARYIPESLRAQYPDVAWKDMVGMRNIMIHQYFGVDTEVLWLTVHEELPALRIAITKILEELDSSHDVPTD